MDMAAFRQWEPLSVADVLAMQKEATLVQPIKTLVRIEALTIRKLARSDDTGKTVEREYVEIKASGYWPLSGNMENEGHPVSLRMTLPGDSVLPQIGATLTITVQKGASPE